MSGPPLPRSLLVPALAAGLLLPTALPGQQPAAQPPTFVESVEVRVVNVDVVVLDRDGRSVVGLTRDDFELLVDGRATPLSNFAAYEESAALAAQELTLETPGTTLEGAVAELPRAAPASTWIVFIDQSNLQIPARNQIVEQTREFIATSLQPGDRSMVATFDGRSLKILSPLSADRQPALDALARLRKQAGESNFLRGNASRIQNDIATIVPGSLTAGFEAQNVVTELQNLAEQHALRLRGSFAAFRDLLAVTAGIEGRVAVLFGAGGYEADPTENLFRALQIKMGGRFDPGPSPNRERDSLTTHNRLDYEGLLSEVNASRVTVYSIFGGERGNTMVGADVGGSPGTAGPSLSIDSAGTGSTIAAFATETGGRAFVGAPDLGERLDAARQDLATYYSLGYHPEGAEPGKLARTEVRVKRDGVRVVARRGVQSKAPEQIAGDAATAALIASAPPANPFGAQIEVGDAAKAKNGKVPAVPVLVRVPLRSLTLLPDGAVHRAQLSFHFSLREPDGGYRRLEARPLDFSVPAEKLQASLGQSIAYKIELRLEPGVYQLGVAIVDRVGGATSTTTAGFRVVKPR